MARIIVFPTKWPLFQFFLSIWKLDISTAFIRPSLESLTYEYLIIILSWGGKELYRFRLYDSERRMADRLNPLIGESRSVYTKTELKNILKVCREELKKIKGGEKKT